MLAEVYFMADEYLCVLPPLGARKEEKKHAWEKQFRARKILLLTGFMLKTFANQFTLISLLISLLRVANVN